MYPDAILKKGGRCGKHGNCAILRGRINLLNRNGEKSDWDNDDRSLMKTGNDQPKLIHSDIIS